MSRTVQDRARAQAEASERNEGLARVGTGVAVCWKDGREWYTGHVECSSSALARRVEEMLVRGRPDGTPTGSGIHARAEAAIRYARAERDAARLRMWGARV